MISYLNTSTGGLPDASCSAYRLPRSRSTSMVSTLRCQASVQYSSAAANGVRGGMVDDDMLTPERTQVGGAAILAVPRGSLWHADSLLSSYLPVPGHPLSG